MAAPTIAQKKAARLTSSNTTLQLTFDSNVVSGAYIVAFVVCSTNYSGLSISDSQSNSYTARQSDGYSDIWGRLYTAQAGSAGSLTITVTLTSGIATIIAFEVNGYSNSSSPEKQGKQWAGISGSASPYSPLNFGLTTAAEQLFLAAMFSAHPNSDRTLVPGSGWTQELQQTTSGGGQCFCAISKAVTSTGTYDPEFTFDMGSTNIWLAGLSIVSGSDGLPAGNVELAGSATAGATGSAALAVQRNLAAAAVAGALASGTLSINRALTGAAIGAALGSATLTAFSSVWRIPTNAPNGTAVHCTVFSGASPTYAILAQGTAVVAGGFIDIPGSGTIGAKAFAFVHNYSDNTATTNIRGGPAIATLTSL